jgi:hypothetical protein
MSAMKSLDTMMTARALKTITDDNEPLRRAHAMALAIEQYLEMLQNDDPGDCEASFGPALNDALMRASDLVVALRAVRLT